jgi:hypothetical protein
MIMHLHDAGQRGKRGDDDIYIMPTPFPIRRDLYRAVRQIIPVLESLSCIPFISR